MSPIGREPLDHGSHINADLWIPHTHIWNIPVFRIEHLRDWQFWSHGL